MGRRTVRYYVAQDKQIYYADVHFLRDGTRGLST